MSLFGLLLLILFVWLGIRIWRFASNVHNINRAYSDAMKRAREQQFRQHQQARQNQPQTKKRIDPNVGEYVEFTEVSEVKQTKTNSGSRTEVKSESQIEDITWEEL